MQTDVSRKKKTENLDFDEILDKYMDNNSQT